MHRLVIRTLLFSVWLRASKLAGGHKARLCGARQARQVMDGSPGASESLSAGGRVQAPAAREGSCASEMRSVSPGPECGMPDSHYDGTFGAGRCPGDGCSFGPHGSESGPPPLPAALRVIANGPAS